MNTQEIPIAKLKESSTNPRRAFDPKQLEELTESVKAHGVLQPILVRKNGRGFEVIAGARRYRAAKAAGLVAVPALVRAMTDREVLEVQVVENLQREDLHPLEEAEGYRQLRDDHGYTVEKLAAVVKRSKAYVHARLKLLALPGPAKKGFLEGRIDASRALLVARIPSAKEATSAFRRIADDADGRRMGYREAADYVRRQHTRDLRQAPWELDDKALLPRAGSCAACPKRSGNLPQEDRGNGRADVCTEPSCFEKKTAAYWQALRKNPERARKLVGVDGKIEVDLKGDLVNLRHYERLSDRVDYNSKTTWKQLAKKAGKPVDVVLVRPHPYYGGNNPIVYAKKKDLRKLLPKEKRTKSSKPDEQQRLERAHKLRLEVVAEAIPELVKRAGKLRNERKFLEFVGRHLLDHSGSEALKAVVKRRGWKMDKVGWISQPEVDRQVRKLSAADLRGLVVELVIGGHPSSVWDTRGYGDGFRDSCKLLGYDHKRKERELAAVRKKKPAKKRPAKKKKKKKKPAKKKPAKKKAKRR